MARQEPVGAIRRPSDYGSGDKDVPEFIRCDDGRDPEMYEVWTFGEDGVTPEVHPTARVDVGAFVGDLFATDYLTPSRHRITMFGRYYINGRVKWLIVPNFLRNDGTTLNLNLLAPYANLGYKGSSTSPNLGSGYGEYYGGVYINWNRPACVLPIYHLRIFDNTRSAAHCARDNLIMENHT